MIPEQGEPVIDDEGVDPQVATSDTHEGDAPQGHKRRRLIRSREEIGSPHRSRLTHRSRNQTETPHQQPHRSKSEWRALKPIGRGKFESTAGLVYDQYRIDHVMEHSRDNTEKPSHGVFAAGTQDEVLALVDEAYELAQKRGPPQVIIEDEGDRTTYTVNMNRQVGRAGGQSGARRRNPPLKMVKIVLEGTSVITAYPTN